MSASGSSRRGHRRSGRRRSSGSVAGAVLKLGVPDAPRHRSAGECVEPWRAGRVQSDRSALKPRAVRRWLQALQPGTGPVWYGPLRDLFILKHLDGQAVANSAGASLRSLRPTARLQPSTSGGPGAAFVLTSGVSGLSGINEETLPSGAWPQGHASGLLQDQLCGQANPGRRVMMRKIALLVAVSAFSALVGATITYWAVSARNVPTGWIDAGPLLVKGDSAAVTFSNEVFTASDLPMPDIIELKVKARFLPTPDDRADATLFGYVAQLVSAPLDLARVPDRYKVKRTFETGRGPAVLNPIEQSIHRAHMTFDLLDKDRFVLLTVEGQTHYIRSGAAETLQGLASGHVPVAVARRVAALQPRLIVDACESCRT